MAETGGTSGLQSEVNAAINAASPTALSVLSRSGNIGRQARVTLNDVVATTELPAGHAGFYDCTESGLVRRRLRAVPARRERQLVAFTRGEVVPVGCRDRGRGRVLAYRILRHRLRGSSRVIGGTGKFSTESIATLTFTLRSSQLPEATGAPFITGAAEVGEDADVELTSGIDDAGRPDQPRATPTSGCAWPPAAVETDIPSARSAHLHGASGRRGQPAQSVEVSFTDDNGNAETLTSEATGGSNRGPGDGLLRCGQLHGEGGQAPRPRLRLFWTRTRIAR